MADKAPTYLLLELADVALSSGSACSSAQRALSHVLLAMGASDDRIRGSVRIAIGRFNTAGEIHHVATRLREAVAMLRSMTPGSFGTPENGTGA